MAGEAQVLDLRTDEGQAAVIGGSRPLQVNRRTGRVQIMTQRGLVVNSMLMRDEWAEIDRVVIEAARYPLVAVNDLRSRGLVHPLGGLGSTLSRWYMSSEVTAANVNMSGRGGANRDLPEMIETASPVPVIFKDFEIDQRALLASRRLFDGLDMTSLREATRVVAEGGEGLLVNGSSVRLNGVSLYGYRSHPNRVTSSATALGGGAWSTIANIVPTLNGAITALNNQNHYGPFVLYASTAQYNAAALNYYGDASGQTPLQRILLMPQISAVKLLPTAVLPAGELLLIQMDSNVADWAEPIDLVGVQVREWASDDGLAGMFKVMMVGTPRVKARYDGKSGIMHITGA